MEIPEAHYDPTAVRPGGLLNFTRELHTTRNGSHLESRCNLCDFRIRDEGKALDEAERVHAASCFGSCCG